MIRTPPSEGKPVLHRAVGGIDSAAPVTVDVPRGHDRALVAHPRAILRGRNQSVKPIRSPERRRSAPAANPFPV